MTFEPIDDDEYETTATRPRPRRPGRRAIRRRYAILGVLAENGPTSGIDLCWLLHRSSGTIYPDLAALEADGRVVGEWHDVRDGYPRWRLYRLPTDDERRARRKRSFTEVFFDPALVKPPPLRWAPRPAHGI